MGIDGIRGNTPYVDTGLQQVATEGVQRQTVAHGAQQVAAPVTVQQTAQEGVGLPRLAAPTTTALPNSADWVALPSPAALMVSVIIKESAQERTTNRSIIQAQGMQIASLMDQQADKIVEGAAQKFACAVASSVVSIAAGAASMGVVGGGMARGADMQSVTAFANALSQSIGGAGNIINAGGDLAKGLRDAEGKRLEADAERVRTMMEQTKTTNEAMRDLISKALDYMNSMQANMNQTRTKILG